MTTASSIDADKPEDQIETCTLPLPLYSEFLGGHKVLWDLRDQGDCRLVVSYPASSSDTPKAVKQDNGKVLVTAAEKNPCSTTTIICHTAMLIASSEYFRKRLHSCHNTSSTSDTGNNNEQQQLAYIDERKDGIICLKEVLSNEDELPVFEAMIKSFYLLEIDPDLTVPQLLKLVELSDRFIAVVCRKASLHVLSTKLSGSWEEDEMNSICNFQPANGEGWQAIEDLVREELIRKYGILYKTYEDDDLRDSWGKLTWKAVRLVLTSDKMELDCEETIALLITLWVVDGEEMRKMKDEDSNRYNEIIADIETNIIRYGLLTPSFCSGYLKEDWLNLAWTHQHQIFRMAVVPKDLPIKWSPEIPALWYTKRAQALTPRDLRWNLTIDEEEFREELLLSLADSEEHQSGYYEVYSKGWWFKFNFYSKDGSVNARIRVARCFQDSVALVNTRVFLNEKALVSVPFLDTTVRNSDGYTELACIMEASVGRRPQLWPANKYFKNGRMNVSVHVESVY